MHTKLRQRNGGETEQTRRERVREEDGETGYRREGQRIKRDTERKSERKETGGWNMAGDGIGKAKRRKQRDRH